MRRRTRMWEGRRSGCACWGVLRRGIWWRRWLLTIMICRRLRMRRARLRTEGCIGSLISERVEPTDGAFGVCFLFFLFPSPRNFLQAAVCLLLLGIFG